MSDRIIISLAYMLREEELVELANKREVEKLRKKLKRLFETRRTLQGSGFIYEEGKIIFPDIRTYLQGSGRTSRLYLEGLQRGPVFFLMIFRNWRYSKEEHPFTILNSEKWKR